MKKKGKIFMNNFESLPIKEAINIIKESNNIFIASHVQPDGDNLGSSLALAMAIKKLNKNPKVIKVDSVPLDFNFLPGINLIKKYDIDQSIDLLISLDSGDLNRLGVGKQFALKANKVINIDHHVSNDNFGDINIVSTSSAATGEIIYEIIKEMGVDIDKDIATCLYTAISTDTGSFMYSNTSHTTHSIAADLLRKGIDINNININLYQNKSMEKTKLFINSLKNLEIFNNNKIGIVSITPEILKNSGAKLEDTEGIISFIRNIGSIEVACLLKEMDNNVIKVSLRSKKIMDVSKIANKFDGGGHVRAAGCTIYENIDKAKELILEEIKLACR